MSPQAPPPLYQLVEHRLELNLHPGQLRAWDSAKRFVAIVAGTQSGKTSFLPLWLWREIKRRGPGDYVFVSPSFTLMETKALPEFKRLFEATFKVGEYVGSPIRKFTFTPEGARRIFRGTAHADTATEVPTHVYFGYAENPDSLESATYKAAVLDEAGQKAFKRESWEAILRRLGINRGRVCIGTTPYYAGGWLKTEIIDKQGTADVDLINFASTDNPIFPREESDRARRDLPGWKFRMFYQGIMTRPAGLIYDVFDPLNHVVPPFALPDRWKRYLGLDFGGVNTAGVFFAEDPVSKKWYGYREYKAGGRTAAGHCRALKSGATSIPVCVGGSKGEDQWRDEFAAGGLPVQGPAVTDVEVGIQRVYGAIARDELILFNTLTGLIDELETYSRVLDDNSEPTEEIDDKSTFHFLDAVRYIVGWGKRGEEKGRPRIGRPDDGLGLLTGRPIGGMA